jgi:hypothetical protein
MIPMRAFFFWGGGPMSWLRAQTIKTFKRHNPAWHTHLFIPETVTKDESYQEGEQQDCFCYGGEDHLGTIDGIHIQKVENGHCELWDEMGPVHRSDIYRYWELSRHGGVYFDTDIVFLKPLPAWVYGDFHVGLTYTDGGKFSSIGVLMSSEANPFWEQAYKAAGNYRKDPHSRRGYSALGVALLNMEFKTLPRAEGRFTSLKFRNLPMSLIAPVDSFHINRLYNSKTLDIGSETIGVHWYGGHQLSQAFNNRISEDTYKDDTTALGQIVQQALR